MKPQTQHIENFGNEVGILQSNQNLYLNVVIRNQNGVVIATDSINSTGNYPDYLNFTASAGNTYYIEFFMRNVCGTSYVNSFFEVDDVFISYEEEQVVEKMNYSVSNQYRYSFQNQEKHDEIRGKGNYINYKYRGYDPRVGRLDWMVDPLSPEYPWYSPYQFSGNRVLDAVELEGLEPASMHLILVNDAGEVEYNDVLGASGTTHLGSYYLENMFPNMGLKSQDFALNSHVTIKFNTDAQKIEGLAESASMYVYGNKKQRQPREFSSFEKYGPVSVFGEKFASKFAEWESDNLSGKAPLPIRVMVKVLPGPSWADAAHTMIYGEDMMSPERGEITGWMDRYALPAVTIGTGVYNVVGGASAVVKTIDAVNTIKGGVEEILDSNNNSEDNN